MDVTGFLYVSLGSSTVQFQESLGSRRALSRSEAAFNSQFGDSAWGMYVITESIVLLCVFFFEVGGRQKGSVHRNAEKWFLFIVGSVCRVKLFITRSRNSLKNVRKSQMMSNQVPWWDCDRSNCAKGGRFDSSWQEDNDRRYSNGTTVFPWFSIQHNAWSFEVSKSVRMVGAQRTEWSRKNEPMGLSLQQSLRYADEEENMLKRLVTGDELWVHH
jgi:hypothetical protein